MKNQSGSRELVLAAIGGLAVGLAVRALADDAFATDRFHGGSRDGYDANSLVVTDPNAVRMRLKGGSYDGWGTATATALKIPVVMGTLIQIR